MAKGSGRPRRYAQYEQLLEDLPKSGQRRAKYVDGIGVFRGKRFETAWIKIRVKRECEYGGTHYRAGSAIEIKLGRLASWDWHGLEHKRDELQGKADRGEPLEQTLLPTFGTWAEQWLKQSEKRLRSHAIAAVHIRCHLMPSFRSMPIDKISTLAINAWMTQRLEHAAPSTVRRELTTLSANGRNRLGQSGKRPSICERHHRCDPCRKCE